VILKPDVKHSIELPVLGPGPRPGRAGAHEPSRPARRDLEADLGVFRGWSETFSEKNTFKGCSRGLRVDRVLAEDAKTSPDGL
jgi:hypothetical protein